ncbi:hypothetical protein B0H13DRAFT_2515947 [Mycena leptocephala]|nr:hypothetical protein B0H13DRAFT_2515947 [Mycena leptocephala]
MFVITSKEPSVEVVDNLITVTNPLDTEKYYWAFDPAGLNRLTHDVAEDFGLPAVEFSIYLEGGRWDECDYDMIHDFHVAKGFDPYSQDAAIAMGQPLIDIEEMKRFIPRLAGESSMASSDAEVDDASHVIFLPPSTRSQNNFSPKKFDSGHAHTLFETHPRLSTTSASDQVVGFCGAYIYSPFSLPSSTAFLAHPPIDFRDCDDIRDAWCTASRWQMRSFSEGPAIYLKCVHVRGLGQGGAHKYPAAGGGEPRGRQRLGCVQRTCMKQDLAVQVVLPFLES